MSTNELPEPGSPMSDDDELVYTLMIQGFVSRKVKYPDGTEAIEQIDWSWEDADAFLFETESAIVAHRVSQMLQGIMTRLPPLDELAIVSEETLESLL